MGLNKAIKKLNLENEVEEVIIGEPATIEEVVEQDITNSEFQETSKDLEEAIETSDELDEVGSEVQEELDAVNDRLESEEPIDPVDVTVVNESIQHYSKLLGLTRESVNLSLEDVRNNSRESMEGLKVELEGIGEKIKEYAKKAWEFILNILKRLKEFFIKLFNKIKSYYKGIVWINKKAQAEFYKTLADRVYKETGISIPNNFYQYDPGTAIFAKEGNLYEKNTNEKDSFKRFDYDKYVNIYVDAIVDAIKQKPFTVNALYTIIDYEKMSRGFDAALHGSIDFVKKIGNTLNKHIMAASKENIDEIKSIVTEYEKALEEYKYKQTSISSQYLVSDWIKILPNKFLDVDKQPDTTLLMFPIDGTTIGRLIHTTEDYYAFGKIKITENEFALLKKYHNATMYMNDVATIERQIATMSSLYNKLQKDIDDMDTEVEKILKNVEKIQSTYDIKIPAQVKTAVNTMARSSASMIEAFNSYNTFLVKRLGAIANHTKNIPEK